jgi:hypothetical protein
MTQRESTSPEPVTVMYVGATGRSGTTLLERILGQASGVFVGWYLASLWHSRKALTTLWLGAHVVLFIGVIQLPFYGQLPKKLFVLMAAVAPASCERDHIAAAPVPMEAPSQRTVGRKLA